MTITIGDRSTFAIGGTKRRTTRVNGPDRELSTPMNGLYGFTRLTTNSSTCTSMSRYRLMRSTSTRPQKP